MDELPENWIDKLFYAMFTFYGERWVKKLGNPFTVELHKTIWFNGLSDCTYAEIKNGLVLCKRLAINRFYAVPSHIKFWHLCKNIPYPDIHVLRRTFRRNTFSDTT
jgi:hypothetical protein